MSTPPLEIERSYLLSRLPDLPVDERCAGTLHIEQGYLAGGASPATDPATSSPDGPGGDAPIVEGRIRRTVHPDGRIHCVHTIKHGTGLVRTEQERDLTEAEFDRLWPLTEGRRISKERHRIRDGSFLWEIDRFFDLDLVLAEVELPGAEANAPIPTWLAPCIVREVTEDPAYRNFEIAKRAGTGRPHPKS